MAKNKQTSEGTLIIGDVHGKINAYWKLLQNHKGMSIQVGDFGLKKKHEWHLKNIDSSLHKINFGNHDDYTYLKERHSLGDYGEIAKGIMNVRGANSIDKSFRTENLDWWSNEELSYYEMNSAIDFYILKKPRVMITHDCPKEVKKELFGISDKSMTTNGLQAMFEAYQPDLWIFGHNHRSKNEIINGTRFICLAELETMTI